jgi:general secretion pathway protein J
MTSGRRVGGFALLELLVALTVLGLLFVGLAQGVQFGVFAWASEVHVTSGNDDFAALDSALRLLIELADPGDEIDPAAFTASSDRLNCITSLPNAVGAVPGRRVRATLLVDADHRLLLQWQPAVRARSLHAPAEPAETELLRGVSRMELEFWRPGGGWVGTWRSDNLPALVRIRLHFPPGDPRHWPAIVAAPMLDRP